MRDWCLKKAYEFRAETAPLVHSAELLPLMTEQLATCLEHFNSTRVELSYNNQHCASGTTATGESSPHISVPVVVEDEARGRLELFAAAPVNSAIQREFVDKLVETRSPDASSRAIYRRLPSVSARAGSPGNRPTSKPPLKQPS